MHNFVQNFENFAKVKFRDILLTGTGHQDRRLNRYCPGQTGTYGRSTTQSVSKLCVVVEAVEHWKAKTLVFGIPMVWREPKGHDKDCLFCSCVVDGNNIVNFFDTACNRPIGTRSFHLNYLHSRYISGKLSLLSLIASCGLDFERLIKKISSKTSDPFFIQKRRAVDRLFNLNGPVWPTIGLFVESPQAVDPRFL